MSVKSNSEDFVRKARKVHGDRFIYDKVVYVTCATKVTITCREHGDFEQKPSEHLRSVGCLHCSRQAKTTKEDFLSKANSIHNYKYDYSEIDYQGINKKISIKCPVHGIFEQIPKSHIKGYGCRFCGYIKRKESKMKGTQYLKEKFVNDAKVIHNNKYDYSKMKFKGLNSDVELVCPEHGSFYIRPSNHLDNQGCRECSNVRRWDTASFINEAVKVHGDLYDYSNCVYVDVATHVEIICKEHGSFWQRPLKHINRGDKCPKCSANFKKTRDEVLSKFQEVHAGKYEYNLKDFKNTNDYIDIICQEHGKFRQTIVSHMSGTGCRMCGYEVVDVFRRSSYVKNCNKNYNGIAKLYFIKCTGFDESFYKIGITCKETLIQRFPKGVHMPYEFYEILFLEASPEVVWDTEKYLHKSLVEFRYEPNIAFGGSKTEFYKFEDVDEVKLKIKSKFKEIKQDYEEK